MPELEAGAVALYLPQFHPTEENDRWWGPGFTEWHNVATAKPSFRGHDQPNLPGELGFYDLRLGETRRRQGELARQHGISAFCYYHYWFSGRRLLHEPLDRMLADPEDEMPFFLCWANEDWTRSWTGRFGETLIRQTYSDQDDRDHMAWLVRVFGDDRYVRVDGRPLFLVYRSSSLPDARRTTNTWRQQARAAGFPDLYLVAVESFRADRGDPRPRGFDAACEFQPDWAQVHPQQGLQHRLVRAGRERLGVGGPRVIPYAELVQTMARRRPPHYPRFPAVTPRWDNTPRRGRSATVLQGSTPALYERWLRAAQVVARESAPVGTVVINAWNEWAEGAYLEPDRRSGRQYLTATASALGISP